MVGNARCDRCGMSEDDNGDELRECEECHKWFCRWCYSDPANFLCKDCYKKILDSENTERVVSTLPHISNEKAEGLL